MKKLIIACTALIVIIVMYGYSQSGQNRIAANNPDPASLNNPERIIDPLPASSKLERKVPEKGNLPDRTPSVLSILINEKGKPAGSNSFLNKLIYGEPGKNGC